MNSATAALWFRSFFEKPLVKRLQITADVDGEGIKRLKQMLTKYEEILKLLQ